ncbi:MAG: FtsX-like permease family protein [Lachnospiraceae bacterium]|nr:FtsX-like permease family protein [Lachnospiraceae bacterium]
MSKEWVLTKSHFRKNKGTSIGLFLLIILAAMMISSSMLLFTDVYPTVSRDAKRLDAGDGFLRFTSDLTGIDDDCIENLMDDETERYESTSVLFYNSVSVPFGAGKVVMHIHVNNPDAFERKMAKTEIILEDESITENYIYLPYQFYTSDSNKIGDIYSFELNGKTYDLTVRGFVNTTYFACNNNGTYEFIVDQDTYDEIRNRDGEAAEAIVVAYELKDGVKQSKFAIRVCNDLLKYNMDTEVYAVSLSSVVGGRTFMSRIIAICFLAISILVLLVIIMMLVNSISNYIKENMQTLGALKAIGYTSGNIKASLLLMFGLLGVLGAALGVGLSYITIPVIADFVVVQMGVPFHASFNPVATVITVCVVVAYVLIVTVLSVGKIRKIDPIIALRGGVEGHNFRKNRIRLDRSAFGLNVSIALKIMFGNMKQNIITFFVTGFIVFFCVITLLMYENFNRDPKLEMLSFEICGGVVGADYEKKDEVYEYLCEREDVSNVRNIMNIYLYYNDEDKLWTYIMDDPAQLKNQNVVYTGRFPEYDNEIAVSGKFAKEYGLSVGDELKLDYGDKNHKYLITGLIQTTNNDGREALLSTKAAEHLLDFTYAPAYFNYDCDDAKSSQKVLDDCTDKFGDHIVSTMNFWEVIEGSMTTFKTIAKLMLYLVSAICAAVILLVLFLLIKSFIYSKRRDFGISKAIGYTSGNLILQTAVSFMPPIILSVLVFSVVSYFAANPYMNLMMGSFGIVKADLDIPIPGVVISCVAIIVISFFFAVFEARRVKKIEAYQMLIAE